MADNRFKVAYQSPEKGMNDLNYVQSAKVEDLCKVASTFYGFLISLDSQEESWLKLKALLQAQAPYFIPKVECAFVYYMGICLQKAFVPDEDTIKSPKAMKDNFMDLYSALKANADAFKYFKYLFTGQRKGSAIGANEIAVNFIEDIFELHGGEDDRALIRISSSHNAGELSIEDFFKTLAPELKTDSEETDENFKKVREMRKSQEPYIALVAILMQKIWDGPNTDSSFYVNLKGEGEAAKLFKKLKTRDQEKFEKFCSKYQDTFITRANRGQIWNDLFDMVSPAKKQVDSKKEEAEAAVKDKMESLRALNMTNYISGRITAEEFQAKDAEIRASSDLLLDETIMEEQED